MADAGINAVEKAIFARLNHASVTALVPTTRHMNSVVRWPVEDQTYPLITVALMTSNAERIASFSGDAETLDYIIRAYDRNTMTIELVGDIADAVDARMHQATLSPTGYAGGIFGIRRIRWVRGVEPATRTDAPYPFAGAVYRLWAQRS